MTEHDSTSGRRRDEDDALRALLRSADPAHDLPPRDPHWITWKVEDTMTNDQLTPQTPARAAASRGRRGLFAGLASATAAAVAVGALALTGGTGATTALTAAPAGSGMEMCAPVSAEALAQRQIAFEGRVTGIADGTVTLEVVHRYQGDVEDEVTVAQPSGSSADESSAGAFEVGQSYLVSADDGRLSVCGQTGAASPELRALYDQAFPG